MLNSTKSSTRDYLIKQLPSATAFINTDFVVIHASDRWVDSFDFVASEVFGKTIFDLFLEVGEDLRTTLSNCFRGQSAEIKVDSFTRPNKKEVLIQWQNLPWYDEKENIIGAIIQTKKLSPSEIKQRNNEKSGEYQNATELISKDINNADNDRLLRTLVDNLPLNVFIKDTESRKILVNKSECEYLGVQNPEELLGKTDFEIYDSDIAQRSRDEDLEVMRSLRPILGRETTSRKKDGSSTTFLTSKIPLVGKEGTVKGLVGISLDISDLKQKEEELRDLINVTSLQNKKLVDFAHIISHNLRSYAANFSMLLEFLLTEKNETEKKNITNMLVDASDGLLETLDNLNEVVAISTNINLNKKPVYLAKAVGEVVNSLSVFLQTNRAKIINKIPDHIQVNVVPSYLESILMYFITNGVKYKDPSRHPILTLCAKIENGKVVLNIEDNGLGIDMTKYGDKLFGMYKTFHHNKDARGIGLYITKNQIEAMKGKVIACSEVGKGTTFKVYFNGEN